MVWLMAKWPYSTARWKRLRLAKLAQDPVCQYCPPGRASEEMRRTVTSVQIGKAARDMGIECADKRPHRGAGPARCLIGWELDVPIGGMGEWYGRHISTHDRWREDLAVKRCRRRGGSGFPRYPRDER